jgi:hypothetical protein
MKTPKEPAGILKTPKPPKEPAGTMKTPKEPAEKNSKSYSHFVCVCPSLHCLGL